MVHVCVWWWWWGATAQLLVDQDATHQEVKSWGINGKGSSGWNRSELLQVCVHNVEQGAL
jgi:hypothetical protein